MAMTPDIGVGIIGCGNISTIYMQNMPLFAGVKLVACADMRPDAAQAQAAKFGIEALSVEALLARPDIGIVINLTIPNAHFGVGMAALRAGKHVFGEKPLATSLADGKALVAEAEARHLLIGCAPDTFLGGGGRLARSLVDDAKVGRILSGTAFLMSHGMEHWHPDPEFFFKPGGGPILDMGPYYITALVNLLGPVASVQALGAAGFAERIITAAGPRTGEAIKVETPTTVMALLTFVSGAHVTLVMSWDVWKHGHPAIELYGTEGSMRVPDPNFFGGIVTTSTRDGEWQANEAEGLVFATANWRSPNWPATRASEANYRCLGLAELARVAREGGAHRSSGRLALHVLETMYGILDACETGRAVAIETVIERPAALPNDEAGLLLRLAAAHPA
jgi:predicted dehydrogenase